jgi:hypothetical protein
MEAYPDAVEIETKVEEETGLRVGTGPVPVAATAAE